MKSTYYTSSKPCVKMEGHAAEAGFSRGCDALEPVGPTFLITISISLVAGSWCVVKCVYCKYIEIR